MCVCVFVYPMTHWISFKSQFRINVDLLTVAKS